MTTLTFQNTTLSVIDQYNQKWISALEVGRALGYKDPSSNIAHLYERNKDEFTSSMTAIIDMDTASGIQKVRIFSLRGCWLLGMRSHTKVAKDFRKWVLDILDKEVSQNPQPNLPLVVEKKYTLTLTEDELRSLAWLWKSAERMRNILAVLYNPLRLLGSQFSAAVYGSATEYKRTLEQARKILVRETNAIETDKWDSNNWNNVLHELRKGELRNSL